MKNIDHFWRQAQSILDRIGIPPLILALGVAFCVFFPRFFLLAAIGYGVFWAAKNIWFAPGGKGWKGRKKP